MVFGIILEIRLGNAIFCEWSECLCRCHHGCMHVCMMVVPASSASVNEETQKQQPHNPPQSPSLLLFVICHTQTLRQSNKVFSFEQRSVNNEQRILVKHAKALSSFGGIIVVYWNVTAISRSHTAWQIPIYIWKNVHYEACIINQYVWIWIGRLFGSYYSVGIFMFWNVLPIALSVTSVTSFGGRFRALVPFTVTF